MNAQVKMKTFHLIKVGIKMEYNPNSRPTLILVQFCFLFFFKNTMKNYETQIKNLSFSLKTRPQNLQNTHLFSMIELTFRIWDWVRKENIPKNSIA